MNRAWPATAKILTGFFAASLCALPQNYTVSAKPGVVNFVEGNAFVNGRKISTENLRMMFLNANDTISTDLGKAEVLLTPGVFLRLSDNTRVRMVSPSLTDTQLEVTSGEAMIEADDIVKDSRISVINGGGTALVERNGLYRFTATAPRSVAVLEGKVAVSFEGRSSDVGKGHQVFLDDGLKTAKFDTKKQDELYAWSNVRAEYNAASSYQAAKDVNASSYGGTWGGYGFSGYSNPGWMWNGGMNSWSWLPGNSAFYSPFGYGFYGPGVVAYAPYVYAPVYGGGGGGYVRNRPGQTSGTTRGTTQGTTSATAAKPVMAAVPVNPVHPPAVGQFSNSFAGNQMARSQAMHSFSGNSFRTASGVSVPAGRASAGSFGGGHASSGGAAVAAGGHASGGSFGGGGHAGGGAGSGASSAGAGGGAHGGGGGASGGGGHH